METETLVSPSHKVLTRAQPIFTILGEGNPAGQSLLTTGPELMRRIPKKLDAPIIFLPLLAPVVTLRLPLFPRLIHFSQ